MCCCWYKAHAMFRLHKKYILCWPSTMLRCQTSGCTFVFKRYRNGTYCLCSRNTHTKTPAEELFFTGPDLLRPALMPYSSFDWKPLFHSCSVVIIKMSIAVQSSPVVCYRLSIVTWSLPKCGIIMYSWEGFILLVVVVSHIQGIGCQPEKNYFTRWAVQTRRWIHPGLVGVQG